MACGLKDPAGFADPDTRLNFRALDAKRKNILIHNLTTQHSGIQMERNITPLAGAYAAAIAACALYQGVVATRDKFRDDHRRNFAQSMADAAGGFLDGAMYGIMSPILFPVTALAWIGRQL